MADLLDLARLTPDDFEMVCKELLEPVLGVRLETFGPGKDAGIDLRGHEADGGLVAVQCKHWERSARDLVGAMRRIERPKVERFAPARYVLATTAALSPSAKDELVSVMRPFVRAPGDVFLRGDLVSLLGRRDDVVRQYARLWFRGADELAALLDKGLFVRAGDLKRDIKRSLEVFVPGRGFAKAVDLLDRQHVCVVSGLPGYGKTTLAHALAWVHANKGYEVIAVSEDADDIDRAWADERPQMFVADDFLGDTRLERRRHRSTARLLRAAERVGAAPDKRLVLTTREYLLRRAEAADERLHDAALDRFSVVLRTSEYAEAARALIALNTVSFSRLPGVVKDEFAAGDAAAEIARHPYFNPRTLAMGVRDAAGGLTDAGALRDSLRRYLDDPSRMWRHIVENQLNPAAFGVVASVFSFGGGPRPAVRAAWEALGRHWGRAVDPREFDSAVHELTGTMVRHVPRGWAAQHHEIAFADNAVAGFAADYFSGRPDLLGALFASALYFEQVEEMWDALCPSPGVVAAAVEEVRDRVVDAVYRTLDGKPLGAWGTFLHRTAALADVAASLGDEGLRHLLRERLRAIHVDFAPCSDEDDETGLHIVVASLIRPSHEFDDDLRALLLPPIVAIDERDIEQVYCLAAFVDHVAGLPDDIRDAAERKIRNVVDAELRRSLDGSSSLDADALWMVARMGRSRSMDVPDIPGDTPAD